jgi:hypothetical protein
MKKYITAIALFMVSLIGCEPPQQAGTTNLKQNTTTNTSNTQTDKSKTETSDSEFSKNKNRERMKKTVDRVIEVKETPPDSLPRP